MYLSSRLLPAWLALIALTCSTNSASAQIAAAATVAERDAARREFRAGVALARSGHHLESCAAFERSLALLPHAATLYNLAQSELSLGQLAAARYHLRQALARDAASDEELTTSFENDSAARLAALEAQLAYVSVTLPVPEAEISVDGRPVYSGSGPSGIELTQQPRGAAGSTSVRGEAWLLVVDPGEHRVELEHAGRREVLVLNVRSGARSRWGSEQFAALAPPKVADSASPVVPLSPGPMESPRAAPLPPTAHGIGKRGPFDALPPSPQRPSELELGAWALAGVGVISTAVFGGLALHERGKLVEACPQPSRCSTSSDVTGRRRTIERWALLADVSLAAAALGVGGGVVIRLVGSGDAKAAGMQVSSAF
ncbi:MAG: hypothetical protein K0R38_4653 [Polyangiaceae bacterium]|jgi:hypothetical protein|nr:hypothetical protein [Polyangiaceae bacterium]